VSLSTIWENADGGRVDVALYTAEEAPEILGCEKLDSTHVLALGGDSGGYFGLEGSPENIRKVLVRALATLDQIDK